MDTCKTVHTHIYIYVYVRMYIYIYVYVYIYMYTTMAIVAVYIRRRRRRRRRRRSSRIPFGNVHRLFLSPINPSPRKKKQNSLYPLRPTSRKLSSPLISSHPLSLSPDSRGILIIHTRAVYVSLTRSLSLLSFFIGA